MHLETAKAIERQLTTTTRHWRRRRSIVRYRPIADVDAFDIAGYKVAMDWTPANEQDVVAALAADWVGIDPSSKSRLSIYMVEPQAASLQRFGQIEQAFIVARKGNRVVFFNDIEEDFGTAVEEVGKLTGVASYGNIAFALVELERLGTDVC